MDSSASSSSASSDVLRERQVAEIVGHRVPFGEGTGDRGLHLGDALLVDGAVDHPMRPPERRAPANLEAGPNRRGGVHADNNDVGVGTLRSKLTQSQHANVKPLLRDRTKTN